MYSSRAKGLLSILYPSIHFTHTNTNTNTNGVVTLSQRLRTRAVQMKHPSSISITSYLDQFVGFVGLVPTCSVSVSTSNVCVFCTGGQCNTSTVVLTEMLALFIWEGVGVTKFRKATVSPTVKPKRYTGPVNIQPDAQFLYVCFISILCMFRVAMCPSSGELLYQCHTWFMSL